MSQRPDPPFEPRRRHLANRRPALTFKLNHTYASGAQHPFFVTIGLYNRNNSEIGEVFINTAGRAGNEADIMAADAAVAISLALQYGCPIEVMTAAMKRNADGSPMGVLSHALDEATRMVGRA